MAITIYTGKDWKYGYIEQTTWGTAITSNLIPIQADALTFSPGVNFRAMERAKMQRYYKTTDVTADKKGAVHTVSLSQPALKESLDVWLYGVFQNVTETDLGAGSGPWKKVFTFPQTQPDFSANAGKFLTIGAHSPLSSADVYVHDAIVSSLNITCSPGTNDGLLTVGVDFAARQYTEGASLTFTSETSIHYYNFNDIANKYIDLTDVVLGPDGFNFTITNGATKVGGTSSLFETFALPTYRCEGSMQILWDSTAKSQLASILTGSSTVIALRWGTADTDGYLSFDLNVKYTGPSDFSHVEEGSYVTLPFTCVGVYGTTEPIQVTLVSTTDRGW